jgi:hypothetical protein
MTNSLLIFRETNIQANPFSVDCLSKLSIKEKSLNFSLLPNTASTPFIWEISSGLS